MEVQSPAQVRSGLKGQTPGRACPGALCGDSALISLSLWARLEAAGPSRMAPGELSRKRSQPRSPNSTCHRKADVERDRERKKATDQSPGKVLPRLRAIIKM